MISRLADANCSGWIVFLNEQYRPVFIVINIFDVSNGFTYYYNQLDWFWNFAIINAIQIYYVNVRVSIERISVCVMREIVMKSKCEFERL